MGNNIKNLNQMNTQEIQDYLGITDNENVVYKGKTISDFRLLADLCEGINYEIILEEDYHINQMTNEIIYKYNNLIAYKIYKGGM